MLGEEGDNKRKIEFFVWKTERNYAKIFFVCLHTNTKVYL